MSHARVTSVQTIDDISAKYEPLYIIVNIVVEFLNISNKRNNVLK